MTTTTYRLDESVRGTSTRRRRTRRARSTIAAWGLVSPALTLTIVFYIAPMLLLVVMSFYNWPLLGQIKPAGIQNYQQAFADANFWSAVAFTLTFTVVLVPLSLAASYATAVIVRSNARGTGFFRTAFFLPVAIGFTAAAYMASVLLTPGTGIINAALHALGLTDGRTTWFSDTTTAFWAVVVITIWKNMGVAMILLMAGMQAIPGELFEAARIDGAGWWRRERSITLPLIGRPLALCLVLAVSGTLLTFDQFYVLTKGGPAGSTITAVLFNYTVSFVRYRLGYGAAISILITIIILSITIFQLRAFRTRKETA